MSIFCTVGYKWVTLMGSIKFEFNDNIVYGKRFFSLDSRICYKYYINYIISVQE